LNAGDRVGHPSCEGGEATGTHFHFARKYNGEWVAAGGPLPFILSGWVAHAGTAPYQGTLTKGDKVITANQFSTRESVIVRQPGE
jgi:LasA protease